MDVIHTGIKYMGILGHPEFFEVVSQADATVNSSVNEGGDVLLRPKEIKFIRSGW